MKLAINEAKKSNESIGCGVVVVKDGRIVAKSYNRQRESNDASAHAEIIAIRKVGKKVGSKNLVGCIFYCTCEPCTMCLSAMIFARVSKLVYGTSMKETFPDNLPITLTTKKLMEHSDHKIEIVDGFMKDECLELLQS